MSSRYEQLNPRDIVITLRSFPRRYDGVAGPVLASEKLHALVDVPGADGVSLRERVDSVARTLALLALEIHRTLLEDDPILNPGALPDSHRDWEDGPDLMLSSATELLSGEANSMADELDEIDASAWSRTAKVAGTGTTVTVTDLAREAVRVGAEELYRAEAQLADLRAMADSD